MGTACCRAGVDVDDLQEVEACGSAGLGDRRRTDRTQALAALPGVRPLSSLESGAESVKWVMDIMTWMWPKLGDAMVKEYTKQAMDEMNRHLEKQKKELLVLKSFSLGTTPPDVQLVSSKAHGDMMRIVLNIRTTSDIGVTWQLGPTEVGLVITEFFANVVYDAGPLIDHIPMVSAVRFCCTSTPVQRYRFTGLAALADIPFVKTAVRNVVDRHLAEDFVMPNWQLMLLVPEEELEAVSPRKRTPIGVLRVRPVRASGLAAADWSLFRSRTSDPYVRVKLAGQSWHTSTANRTLDPVWPDTDFHDFVVFDEAQRIVMEVLDDDWISEDDHLGCIAPMEVRDALASSGTSLPLVQGAQMLGSDVFINHGAMKGVLETEFRWLDICAGTLQGAGQAAAEGCLLAADVGNVVLPGDLAESVQVLLKVGDEVATSSRRKTPKGAAAEKAKATARKEVDMVIRGCKLGVPRTIIAEMTGLEPAVVARILVEEGLLDQQELVEAQKLPASLHFRSYLCVALSLADLATKSLELQILDSSKNVLAKTCMMLSEVGLAWPGPGKAPQLELWAAGGRSVKVDVTFSVSGLFPGKLE